MRKQIDLFQQKAILQTESVLLEAGAGAGKTFVLIEHIIFLLITLKNTIGNEDLTDQNYQKKIKSYLSGLVLITFTVKATAEMQIRLIGRIEEELEIAKSTKDQHFWKVVLHSLDEMTVSTIHSFCFKLIRQNALVELLPDADILEEGQVLVKIKKLLELWFEKKLAQKQQSALLDYLFIHFDILLDTIFDIFNRPELRLMWGKRETFSKNNTFFEDLLTFHPMKDFFINTDNFILTADDKTKKWGALLDALLKIKQNGFKSYQDWRAFADFFAGIERMPPAPKKAQYTEINNYWSYIKEFRQFVQENDASVSAYYETPHELISSYKDLFEDLISFIEKNYFSYGGLAFSDLEFLLIKQGENQKFLKKISDQYHHVIVDEFQDVSFAQFTILKFLIQNNFDKLFAVGDMKQAIYGFRGGELEVFLSLQRSVKNFLVLVNNYRSTQKIIEHNNTFFDFIFKKGPKFEGEEILPIPLTPQKSVRAGSMGAVYRICVELEENVVDMSANSQMINQLEALSITRHIQWLQKESETPQYVTILYKSLSPLRTIIPCLMEASISFKAQFKMDYKELPLLIIFKELMRFSLSCVTFTKKEEVLLFEIQTYISSLFEAMGLTISLNMEHLLRFFEEKKLFNVVMAYERFLHCLSLSHTYYEFDLLLLEKILCSVGGDESQLYKELLSLESKRLSFDYQWGDHPLVQLMSAHSSKGLQFDHVILGGIYTNGYGPRDISLLGKWPNSFYWSPSADKVRLASPEAILEKLANIHKEFSESKRLFYVAATRAKESLSFVLLPKESLKFSHPKNSWIEGLLQFEHPFYTLHKGEYEDLSQKISLKDVAKGAHLKRSLYFVDTMGITLTGQGSSPLGAISELSVTDLSALLLCPYKFYLQNICDLQNELPFLEEHLEKKIFQDFSHKKGGTGGTKGGSSKERGDRLHMALSKMIRLDTDVSELKKKLPKEDHKALQFAFHHLREQRGRYFLESETLMKFSVKGVMITGACDLLLTPINSGDFYEIWDFKTGKRDRSTGGEEGYFLQLNCYALAAYDLGLCPLERPVRLTLLYLDEEEVVTHQTTRESALEMVESTWPLLANLHKKRLEHCSSCEFSFFCHENKKKS